MSDITVAPTVTVMGSSRVSPSRATIGNPKSVCDASSEPMTMAETVGYPNSNPTAVPNSNGMEVVRRPRDWMVFGDEIETVGSNSDACQQQADRTRNSYPPGKWRNTDDQSKGNSSFREWRPCREMHSYELKNFHVETFT